MMNILDAGFSLSVFLKDIGLFLGATDVPVLEFWLEKFCRKITC